MDEIEVKVDDDDAEEVWEEEGVFLVGVLMGVVVTEEEAVAGGDVCVVLAEW